VAAIVGATSASRVSWSFQPAYGRSPGRIADQIRSDVLTHRHLRDLAVSHGLCKLYRSERRVASTEVVYEFPLVTGVAS
jgi:hypothetical protein